MKTIFATIESTSIITADLIVGEDDSISEIQAIIFSNQEIVGEIIGSSGVIEFDNEQLYDDGELP